VEYSCKPFDFQPAAMDDEALVVLAKECDNGPARTTLLLRYQDWTARLITSLARRRGLSDHDRDDAVQDARFFGLSRAIERYDTRQLGRAGGCRFRSFLRRVLSDRFKDFLKHLRRVKARHTPLWSAEAGGEAPAGHGRSVDPALEADRQEQRERVRRLVSDLGDRDRQVVEGVCAGCSLRELAPRLGLSYDTAKRLRRKLLAELAARLEPARA
jgi:RNA polymerase sigma factor (sigma-70 family)